MFELQAQADGWPRYKTYLGEASRVDLCFVCAARGKNLSGAKAMQLTAAVCSDETSVHVHLRATPPSGLASSLYIQI
eukprot:1928793-Rhodomonas_salina.2